MRVYYEDTDSGGVVYHANYLRYFERARTEWLRAKGVEQDGLKHEAGVIFAVRAMNIDFIKPALFNQSLTVEVVVAEANRLTVHFEQRILLQNGDIEPPISAADTLLCAAQVKVVSLDAATLKPRRMPDHIFKEITRGH